MKRLILPCSALLCSLTLVSCSTVSSQQSAPIATARSANQPSRPATNPAGPSSLGQTSQTVASAANPKSVATTQRATPATPITRAASPSQNSDTNVVTDLEPEIGTITAIESGDLMCYISFIDEQGVARTEGASFELCDQQQFVNQRVRLVYGVGNVNDCTSNEPCGRTKTINLVVKIDPLEDEPNNPASDTIQLANGPWTVTVGNLQSWSGVNGTGNLTYEGCNGDGDCLSLTGGTVTCRDGMCYYAWQKDDYSYILTTAIGEDSANSPYSLVIKQGDTIVQQTDGFQ